MFKKSEYATAVKELEVAQDALARLEVRAGQLSSGIAQSSAEIHAGEQRIDSLIREDATDPGVDAELRKVDATMAEARQWLARQSQLQSAVRLEVAKAKLAITGIEGRILTAQVDHHRNAKDDAFEDVWSALRKVLPGALRTASSVVWVTALLASDRGNVIPSKPTFRDLWAELGRALQACAERDGVDLVPLPAQKSGTVPLTRIVSDRLSAVDREALRRVAHNPTPESFLAAVEMIEARDAPILSSAAECRGQIVEWESKVAEHKKRIEALQTGMLSRPEAWPDDDLPASAGAWGSQATAKRRDEQREEELRKRTSLLDAAELSLTRWKDMLAEALAREAPGPSMSAVNRG